MRDCKHCGATVNNIYAFYCSNQCQHDFQYQTYIKQWKQGQQVGQSGVFAKTISKHIRRYLSEKQKDGCSLCGWNEINPTLAKCPLEIDHIDGNSENNTETNLRMICPNCHSLTSNFRNLNRGNGREWRRLKYIKNK